MVESANRLFLQAVNILRKRPGAFLLPLIAGLAALAWANRFIQDDAYISFRYARNLVEGHGLVWNPGYRVEGYTNFLWTLIMAVPIALGIDVVSFSFGLGVALFVVSLSLMYQLGRLAFSSQDVALLGVALLGTNYSFSVYATGGLETQLQACLFLAAFCLLALSVNDGRWMPGRLLALAFVLSAALLTRLDSGLMVAVIGVAAGYYILRSGEPRSRLMASMGALTLPIVVLIGGWLLWKWLYYGDILPNTYYIKAGSTLSPRRGAYYLSAFFLSYLLAPFAFIGVASTKRFLQQRGPLLLALAALVGLWSAYLVLVGGDFMEFRMMVPVLPMLIVLILWLLVRVIQENSVRAGLVAMMLAGSLHHALTFDRASSFQDSIEGVERLEAHLLGGQENWTQVGRALGEAFAGHPDVSIAVTAAGAVPYYSRLETVDMLGLNDTWVARHGERLSSRPGHQRRATFDYLLEQEVNLVIGHPRLVDRSSVADTVYSASDLETWFAVSVPDPARIPTGAVVAAIPVDEDNLLMALYLSPHPAVDEAINRDGWQTYPIAR